MKRLVPLLITAIGGFVLIGAFFVPAGQKSGEIVAVWFDILASIAFILGGGNLIKVHLKKISDHAAGWGYSGVTLIAFFVTLGVGMLKVGVAPAPHTEFYGELFAPVPLEEMPVASVAGGIPTRGDAESLPASVRPQTRESDGQIRFHGWMSPTQAADLEGYQDTLEWRATVETLAEAAQPPEALRGKAFYRAGHHVLGFRGRMTDADRAALEAVFAGKPAALRAISDLYDRSRRTTTLAPVSPPAGFQIPTDFADVVALDGDALSIHGPMSEALRDEIANEWPNYPRLRPLTAEEAAAFKTDIAAGGDLTPGQSELVDRALASAWTADQFVQALNSAGVPTPQFKSARELLAEREAGATELDPSLPPLPTVTLNAAQEGVIRRFAEDSTMPPGEVLAALQSAGDWTGAQAAAFETFLRQQPTLGELKQRIAFEFLKLHREHPEEPRPTVEQFNALVADAQAEHRWRATMQELFERAHVAKFPWSGEYQAGGALSWLFDYVFQPLVSTMFALLAFYVASAAFRAFRAKNVEAILLLGTAFIILIAQTPAGAWLTSWVPDSLSALQADEMKRYIMSLFNTAGNRAIMIGIALGIAATSLKILLGVDRSYLGSGDD